MIKVQEEDFDIGAEISRMTEGNTEIGGLASFVGLVRDYAGNEKITSMTLEHYPGMTEKALAGIVSAAMQRWELIDALVIHRVGKLKPQDQIVLVAVASKHRGESFAACEFIMDYLKSEAPFWKKEQTPQGARWVDARVTDDKALVRWGIASNNAATSTADQPGVSAQANDYE